MTELTGVLEKGQEHGAGARAGAGTGASVRAGESAGLSVRAGAVARPEAGTSTRAGALSMPSSRSVAKTVLRLNMWFIMIGVLVLAIASIVTFLIGIIHFILFFIKDMPWQHFHVPHKFNAVICQVLEINLIAVILFISAIGLYLLFWKDIRVPAWLAVNNVNQLKEKLVGIMITVMGVTFLEHLLEWHDPKAILMFGAAIALVTIALVFYMKIMASEGGEGGENEGH